MEKTSLFFSANTPEAVKEEIQTEMGVLSMNQMEKYLGLPPIIGKSKRKAFEEIKNKIWRKVGGWKEKLLSQAGKEVLIKLVAQAIPTYAMSVFQLPVACSNEINSMLSNYWWGQKHGERRIHWMGWKKLARSKKVGGMGFRDLKLFNSALLARQCWRLLHNPHSLIFRVLKSKYFPNSSFLEAKMSPTASYAWKSLLGAREVIELGSRWRVGSGTHIRIWKDRWLPTRTTFKVQSPVNTLHENATVDSLIIQSSRQWNVPLIDEIFEASEAAIIKSIPLSNRISSDVLIWSETRNGMYSVKSAYHLLMEAKQRNEAGESSNTSRERDLWKGIWEASVPQKIKLFIWKACKGILPTKLNLFRKKVSNSFTCEFCDEEPECFGRVSICSRSLGT